MCIRDREKVIEEEDDDQETSEPKEAVPKKSALKAKQPAQAQQPQQPPQKENQKARVRRSLATFATFTLEPEAVTEKKRKRKLGGLGKTLFDDDDENADASSKALPGSRGLFAGVGAGRMGPLAGLMGGRGSFLVGGGAAGAKGGLKRGLLATEDGFQFSPLKRQRKEMSFAQ